MVPEKFQIVIKLNPLYSYLQVFRGFLYQGSFAPTWNFVVMAASAVIFLLLGVWAFSKSWRAMVVRV